jgi:hypothetical protein
VRLHACHALLGLEREKITRPERERERERERQRKRQSTNKEKTER